MIGRHLTVEDMAVVLRTTETGVRRMRERGTLPPAVKIGSRILWDENVVRAWIDEHREAS
jgi:predicted DNA-binding transcriptional regulator AlpA